LPWRETPVACDDHDIDIPAATLSGALTVGGAAATPEPQARLLLRDGLNDLVEIPIAGARYSVRLAPGTYDVFFSATGATARAPVNQFARLHSGIVVAPYDAARLDIEVPVTTVAGTIAIAGAPPPAGDAVHLSLRNADGDTVAIAVNGDGSYAARIVPGTFDLFYVAGAIAPGSATPLNQLAKIASGVVIPRAGATRLDLDVPSATVSGTIAIGGVPAGPTNRGNVFLRNAAGDTVKIAVANAASYTARVVPGRYDLYFAGTEDALSVGNQNARLQGGVVVGAGGTTVIDVQVPAATVEGALSLDGDPPAATDNAHLMLRDAAGDWAEIPWSSDGRYRVRVVPGTYDLFYAKDNRVPGATPVNQLAKLRAGVLVAPAGTTVLDIDVASAIVTGAVRINGAPAAAGNSGIVSLRSADGDRVTIANTASASYTARVVPGTYDVYYTRTATPTNTMTEAPANHAALLQAGIVVAPGAANVLDVDIPSATVTGTITVNGASAGTGDTGWLLLRSAAGDFATFASTNAESYVARLVPGTYDVYFSNAGSVGDSTPMNTQIKLRCFSVP
jgi:hypothetical protein